MKQQYQVGEAIKNLKLTIDAVMMHDTESGYYAVSGFCENTQIYIEESPQMRIQASGTFNLPLQRGMDIVVSGDIVNHPKFGFQIKTQTTSFSMPDSDQVLINILTDRENDETFDGQGFDYNELNELSRWLNIIGTSILGWLKMKDRQAEGTKNELSRLMGRKDSYFKAVNLLGRIKNELFFYRLFEYALKAFTSYRLKTEHLNEALFALHLYMSDTSNILDLKKLGALPADVTKDIDNIQEKSSAAHESFHTSPIALFSEYDDEKIDKLVESIIRTNPYCILTTNKLPFYLADNMNRYANNAFNSSFRLKYALLTVLHQNEKTERFYTPLKMLAQQVFSFLKQSVKPDDIKETLVSMKASGHIVHTKDNCVARGLAYNCEAKIASFINDKLSSYKPPKNPIPALASSNDIIFAPEQIQAIERALNLPVSILTGGPGRGKSATVNGIIESFLNKNLDGKVIITGPTGKAAQRLVQFSKTLPLPYQERIVAGTIHSVFSFSDQIDNPYIMNNNRHRRSLSSLPRSINCKEKTLVIIDEFSMVDTYLAAHTLSSLNSFDDLNLVIIGDGDQLKSVGPGRVLVDLINWSKMATTKLETPHRTGDGSDINRLADLINESEADLILDNSDDFNNCDFAFEDDESVILDEVVESVKAMINAGVEKDEIKVITPVRKPSFLLSTRSLNALLQPHFVDTETTPIVLNEIPYYVGDRIEFTRNFAIKSKDDTKKGTKIYNGDVGKIVKIKSSNIKSKCSIHVQLFDGKVVKLNGGFLKNIEHGYANTFHKSQGSEFKHLIIIAHDSFSHMLNKPLIYTGITRSKSTVSIHGSESAIRKAIITDPEPPIDMRLIKHLDQDLSFIEISKNTTQEHARNAPNKQPAPQNAPGDYP